MRLAFLKSNKKIVKNISGWGRNNSVDVEIISPKNIEDIENIVKESKPKSIIARGEGRSYGDAAQVKEGKIIKLNNFKKIFPNYERNEITAQAGATFEEILEIIIPKGFFLPVTPGTKKITLGGAIAADVHGKNHHQDGSFGNYVKRINLINGFGNKVTLIPNQENNLEINEQFWATVGGMGLTGIILDATFSIIPIETSYIKEETLRYKNIEDLMNHMLKIDNLYKYSVAWIDSMHNDFRGILTYGNHVKANEIKKLAITKKLTFNPKSLINIPDLIPINLMNKIGIKIFNEIWFRKTPRIKSFKIVSIDNFFYPLDKIDNWNNIYGKNGFIQYQIIIPDKHSSMIKKILLRLKQINANSFLPVLKRLGESNKGYLSFPMSGWTISIDLPANNKKVEDLLNDIDIDIAQIGGRIYLAKDSRQSAIIFKKTYKSINFWLKQKQILDPKNIFISDIAIRLKLFN